MNWPSEYQKVVTNLIQNKIIFKLIKSTSFKDLGGFPSVKSREYNPLRICSKILKYNNYYKKSIDFLNTSHVMWIPGETFH